MNYYTDNIQIEELYRDDSLNELINDSDNYWMFSSNSNAEGYGEDLTEDEIKMLLQEEKYS